MTAWWYWLLFALAIAIAATLIWDASR